MVQAEQIVTRAGEFVFQRNFPVAITAFAQQSRYLSSFFDNLPVCY
jgi:hypothetical protein